MKPDAAAGMDRLKIKHLLDRSKQEPVNCAIGVGEDKTVALLRLATNRSGRTLEGELKELPGTFNTRFGTALVETDVDPTLVKFILNKPVGSMARRLVKALKGTGYRKVQILLEDGSPVEAAVEEADDAAPGRADATAQGGSADTAPDRRADPATTAAQVPPPPDAAALTRALAELSDRVKAVADPVRREPLSKLVREAIANLKFNNLVYAATNIEQLRRALQAMTATSGPQSEARPLSNPPPPAETRPDPTTALIATLTTLARRIADVADPERQEALANLARAATAHLKQANLAEAAKGIEQLRQALEAVPATQPTNVAPATTRPTAPTATQQPDRGGDPRAIWREAKDMVDASLNALASELRSHGDPDMQRIADLGLTSLGRTENVGLNRALIEFATATGDKREAARRQLRDAIAAYRSMLSTRRALFDLLATTPFSASVPFVATIGGALDRIERALG